MGRILGERGLVRDCAERPEGGGIDMVGEGGLWGSARDKKSNESMGRKSGRHAWSEHRLESRADVL